MSLLPAQQQPEAPPEMAVQRAGDAAAPAAAYYETATVRARALDAAPTS